MSSKKKRIKAPSLRNTSEFLANCDELARLDTELAKARAKLADRLQDVRAQYEPAVVALETQRGQRALAAEKFATEHRDELLAGKAKSAESPLAIFGFRLGQPTLKTLNRAWTWDRVLEELSARGLSRFIRVKREPDKEALKQHLPPEQLAAVGCRIDQTETFFVEAKDTTAAESRAA